jgi:hypothetical protein
MCIDRTDGGKFQQKRQRGSPISRWGDNNEIDLTKLGCECVNWI